MADEERGGRWTSTPEQAERALPGGWAHTTPYRAEQERRDA
ncbi:hypothetical protein [Kitasatospora sp. NA04385]|nr:hypothetical protein [Kitasatospora sp. NA04385]